MALSSNIRKLTALFKGKDDVDFEFEKNVGDGDVGPSGFQTVLGRIELFIAKIKPILIGTALITFICLIITVIAQSNQISAMKEEFKDISATGEWLFFFAKEPELKVPFQHRLDEAFHARNGTGIRMKIDEKCLGVVETRLGLKAEDSNEAVCSTVFGHSSDNRTISVLHSPGLKDRRCIYCNGPDCFPYMLPCQSGITFRLEHQKYTVMASVTAVDLNTGRLYFAISIAAFPLECACKCDQLLMIIIMYDALNYLFPTTSTWKIWRIQKAANGTVHEQGQRALLP